MIGVNKVILIGNLGKNPDVVALPQDRNDETSNVVKKASFPLATTEYRRNREGERIEQTEWHNVVQTLHHRSGGRQLHRPLRPLPPRRIHQPRIRPPVVNPQQRHRPSRRPAVLTAIIPNPSKQCRHPRVGIHSYLKSDFNAPSILNQY